MVDNNKICLKIETEEKLLSKLNIFIWIKLCRQWRHVVIMQIENERRKVDSNLVISSYKANTLSTGPLCPLKADELSITLI